MIAARLPVRDWPRARLLVTAVDTQEGELVAFDRESGVDLVDAVTASCALPGVWPAATVDGRRYVDGGINAARWRRRQRRFEVSWSVWRCWFVNQEPVDA